MKEIDKNKRYYIHRRERFVCSVLDIKKDPLTGDYLRCKPLSGEMFYIAKDEFKQQFLKLSVEKLILLKKAGKIKEKVCDFCEELHYNKLLNQWELPVLVGENVIGVVVKACPYCSKIYETTNG